MIEPAMAAEEWASVLSDDLTADDQWENLFAECCGRHETAARALHGQPFGFTWDDVWQIDQAIGDGEECKRAEIQLEKLRGLMDRIAALLPPRGPDE